MKQVFEIPQKSVPALNRIAAKISKLKSSPFFIRKPLFGAKLEFLFTDGHLR
jgi:hypothetical protein